ncbi:CDP-diacylglycerol--serine O-phosphatidyltransferase [Paradesulfitobacterium ferrireducens]|uniref:CDP-diacylglycerol--serine O-phosphatidyltransferase n=1 Tax=Paradesulfitobacterium ferrireducens TaxID=2816476 RepID=UPI001A8F61E8|nr:CDP-diacylglycerol--serine O-phosphatidyltransferase [Paradesulfitobacterium ferrireducens]
MNERALNTRMIPSIFTLANLVFGFLSLVWTVDGKFKLAAGMVLLSVLMDSLDGKVARKLAVSSDFGKELDSLSDLVSFGVAPALLTYRLFLQDFGVWGLLIAIVFPVCGAIRLARFNILNISTHFLGVPITFAGGFTALLVLFHGTVPWVIFPVSMVALSGLMVSSIRVPKLGK